MEAIEDHLEHLRLLGHSAATIYGRLTFLRQLGRALPVPLLDADAATLGAWRASLTVSDEVIVHYVGHARAFYESCVASGLISANPAAGIPVPRTARRLPRPVGEPDLMRALALATPRIRPWLILAAWCGLRAKEIALLRRESVLETASPPVLIVAAGATKGHARERAVPLNGFVIAELQRAGLPPSGYVFRRMDGQPGPCTPGLISHYANIHLHECGVQATLHSLRHRYGTQIYRGTRDLRLTQDLLGHSSPVVTAGYAAYDRPSAHAAVAALPVPERLRIVAG
jgi:integrase/recombinase XerC